VVCADDRLQRSEKFPEHSRGHGDWRYPPGVRPRAKPPGEAPGGNPVRLPLRTLGDLASPPGDGPGLPAVRKLDLSPGLLDGRRRLQGVLEDLALLAMVAGFAEHRPTREAHMDPARRSDAFHAGREIRHRDRRDPPRLDLARDQTPGLVAEGSDGDDESEGYPVLRHRGSDGRGRLLGHFIGPRSVANEAEDARGERPETAFADE